MVPSRSTCSGKLTASTRQPSVGLSEAATPDGTSRRHLKGPSDPVTESTGYGLGAPTEHLAPRTPPHSRAWLGRGLQDRGSLRGGRGRRVRSRSLPDLNLRHPQVFTSGTILELHDKCDTSAWMPTRQHRPAPRCSPQDRGVGAMISRHRPALYCCLDRVVREDRDGAVDTTTSSNIP